MTFPSLLRQVWAGRAYADAKLVRAYVKRLRRKLGDDASQPSYIVTERRVGYAWLGPGTPDGPVSGRRNECARSKDRYAGTPEAKPRMSETELEYLLGWRLKVVRREVPALRIEVIRTDSPNDDRMVRRMETILKARRWNTPPDLIGGTLPTA